MTDSAQYLANAGDLFLGLFPVADTLTSIQKIGIVFLIICIVSLVLYLLTFQRLGNSALYLVLGIDILLFILFAGIGYIETGTIILVTLLLLGLTYLKVRS